MQWRPQSSSPTIRPSPRSRRGPMAAHPAALRLRQAGGDPLQRRPDVLDQSLDRVFHGLLLERCSVTCRACCRPARGYKHLIREIEPLRLKDSMSRSSLFMVPPETTSGSTSRKDSMALRGTKPAAQDLRPQILRSGDAGVGRLRSGEMYRVSATPSDKVGALVI